MVGIQIGDGTKCLFHAAFGIIEQVTAGHLDGDLGDNIFAAINVALIRWLWATSIGT